jgi:hypothetical protein
MFVRVLTTCHIQYSWDRSICVFYFIKKRSKFLLHTLQVCNKHLELCTCLTCSTCSSVTDGLPVFFLLHTHPVSWNCAHHLLMELSGGGCFLNLARNCCWTIVTDRHSWIVSTQSAFSLQFAAILVNCAPSGKMHNYCTPHLIKENSENFLIHRCNYILLSQVYRLWQVVKIPTIVLNDPVYTINCNASSSMVQIINVFHFTQFGGNGSLLRNFGICLSPNSCHVPPD